MKLGLPLANPLPRHQCPSWRAAAPLLIQFLACDLGKHQRMARAPVPLHHVRGRRELLPRAGFASSSRATAAIWGVHQQCVIFSHKNKFKNNKIDTLKEEIKMNSKSILSKWRKLKNKDEADNKKMMQVENNINSVNQ